MTGFGLFLPLCLAASAPALSERLEKWKREIEQRGGQLVVARIETDRETNQVRVPPDTPRRVILARFLSNEQFRGQFLQTHAMTLNHEATAACVTAERAFLRRMGGGCQSPVAAHAVMASGMLELHGVSFRGGPAGRATVTGPATRPALVGEELAIALARDQPSLCSPPDARQ